MPVSQVPLTISAIADVLYICKYLQGTIHPLSVIVLIQQLC